MSISEKSGLSMIRPGDINILSIGISTGGQAELKMLEGNPRRRVIATTIDEEGLKYTRDLLAGNDRIETKFEDVSEPMPYETECIDFIYARLVLHYLDDASLARALDESYRVLKKDGRIFIVVRSINDHVNTSRKVEFFPETGLTRVPPPPEKSQYTYRRFHSIETLSTAIKKAGFDISYMKEYEEQLFRDYKRTEKGERPSSLIECVGVKK